jgi:hypothetical protein
VLNVRSNAPWKCGNSALEIRGTSAASITTVDVEDNCPACSNAVSGHMDNFTTSGSCSGIPSLPNAVTVRCDAMRYPCSLLQRPRALLFFCLLSGTSTTLSAAGLSAEIPPDSSPTLLSSTSADGHATIGTYSSATSDAFGNSGFQIRIVNDSVPQERFVQSIIRRAVNVTILNPRRALIVGFATGDVSAFTVFDPSTGRVDLNVPCFSPSLSPDRRFVAFVRFFPPHFTPIAETTNIYSVLDLSKQIPTATHMQAVVGDRVYPPPDPATASDSYLSIHQLRGQLTWDSNSTFSFIDEFQGIESQVLATFNGTHWTSLSRKVGPSPEIR